MNILYIITILAIYILFMLIHKTEKKQNLGMWLVITSILILCYNVLICVLFSFINILCTLQNLSIGNGIIIILLSSILAKSKKLQKYYIKKLDIIIALLFLIGVIVIAYKNYGFPFKIKYEITDASIHYYYAQEFYENSQLLYKNDINNNFGMHDSDFRLPGAYVNEGILFKLFNPGTIKVNVFIIFDLCTLYLSSLLFYYLLTTYIVKENRKLQVLAIIFSLLYMLGYQLNSILYGYVYLTLALEIVIAFLLMMAIKEKEQIEEFVVLPILALISFGIFFSYAYFIPIIFIAIIINIIIQSKASKKKLFSEENLIELILTIINPLILGLTFFVLLPKAKGIQNEISTLITDGEIYKNYITNLLVFIPIIIFGIILRIKNKDKKIEYGTILFILSILFVIILFIGKHLGKVSDYYCFKAYFIIWPLTLYVTYTILCKALENGSKAIKISMYIYITIYVIAIIVSTLILKKDIGINSIFHKNLEIIEAQKSIVESEELEMIRNILDSYDKKEIYVLNPKYHGRVRWLTVLFSKYYIYLDTINAYEITIDYWLENKEQRYYLAFYSDYEMTKEKEPNLVEDSEKYKIIETNEYGFMLERKNIEE